MEQEPPTEQQLGNWNELPETLLLRVFEFLHAEDRHAVGRLQLTRSWFSNRSHTETTPSLLPEPRAAEACRSGELYMEGYCT